ncbi:MAG: CHASE4 domain-containing protein, partial [Candidatus Bathyarchaeia archaeon]
MKLRLKSVIVVCVTVFMLLAIFSSIAYVVVLSSFSELEKEHVTENVQRAKNVLEGMISDLDLFLLDWSCWDDTYYFVMDNNTEYIEANLLDLTFINAELNAIIFVNSSGQIVFSKAFDLNEQAAIPISQSLLSNIEDSDLLWNHSETTSHVSGLLLLQEGPMLIASRPITMSSGEGPIAGALLMGRNLDDAKIQELIEKAALTLSIQRLDDSQLQSDFQTMFLDSTDSEQISVMPQNSDIVLGYTFLSDIYGNPILVLQVDMPRNIYKQGLASLYYIIYSIVVGGLVFLGVFLILLEKLILARIEKISNTTKEIRKTHNLSLRVPEIGSDELSDFSREFNKMLSTVDTLEHKLRNYSEHLEELVEQRTEELKKNQEKLKSILSASPDAITATDLNGIITECNEQTLRMHEYASKGELIGKNAFVLIAPNDHKKAEEKIKETLEKGYVKNVEYTFLTKNGREFPAELSASVIRNQNGKPVGFVAITKDISERKQLEQQLFKAQKLAAIGELAGMVGHDLRNPLTGIQGAVYYLKTKHYNKLDNKSKEMITIIQDAINRSNKIINDLLEYA